MTRLGSCKFLLLPVIIVLLGVALKFRRDQRGQKDKSTYVKDCFVDPHRERREDDPAVYYRCVANCTLPEVPLRASEDAGSLARVHVAYSCDSRQFRGLLVSMISLARHLRAPGMCTIHLIIQGDDMARAGMLVECFRREVSTLAAVPEVVLHELRPTPMNTSIFTGHPATKLAHAYVKFYLHTYIPTAPRVIWLDSDMVVKSDVGPLYQAGMRGALVATPIAWDLGSYLSFCGLDVPGKITDTSRFIFQTGLVVLDLRRWGSEVNTTALESWATWAAGCMSDQTALNLYFYPYDLLDWRWNVAQLGMRLYHVPALCTGEARALHFSGRFKPWLQGADGGPGGHVYDHLILPYTPRHGCGAFA